jgi:type IV secretion system protein VirD4
MLWLSTSVAGLAFVGRWPDLGLDDTIRAATRLPHHWEDPRRAWPTQSRAALAGAAPTYGTAAALLIVLCGTAATAVARIGPRKPGRVDGASWARGTDLRGLLAWRPQPGRVALGRRGVRLVCAERLHSTLVIGPTQTGKTTGVAIPAILEWDGPVLATSVKTDLLRDTVDARRERGDVQLFDPAGSTGRPSSSWTPLAGCSSWAGARRTAAWLAEGANPHKRNLSDGDFWYAAATKLLAPLLFAAATSDKTMGDVVRWIDTQETHEVRRLLSKAKVDDAINAFEASALRDERQSSSIYTTAETILEAYADPGVLVHSESADVCVSDLFDGGQRTLYLSATVREQRRLRPVFVALIESVVEEAYRRSAATEQPLDPPLLIVLDEAANISPLQDLDVIAATAAGHGVQLVTVLQDLAQAHDRWGPNRADTIVNNHRARLIAGGTADSRTLDYVATLLGDAEVATRSFTIGESGRRSTTMAATHRPLVPRHAVREARDGRCLLLYGHLRPAWIKFRPWYRVRSLSRHRARSRVRSATLSRPGSR